MELEKILHISGRPGLFKLLASSKNGLVAQSLLDDKKLSVSARQPVMSLGDVAIYAQDREIPLHEVFGRIFEKEEGKKTITHKSSQTEIETLFDEVMPDRDTERVYFSDMKKVLQWYNLLLEKGIISEESLKEAKEKAEKAEKTEK